MFRTIFKREAEAEPEAEAEAEADPYYNWAYPGFSRFYTTGLRYPYR